MAPYLDSTPLLDDPAALRERADTEGYLCFRDLLPAQDVLALRRAIAELAARHGWLDPGTDPMEGISTQKPRIEGTPEFYELYDELQKLEIFHALPHHPRIIGTLEKLFGETVLVHARHIARVIFPNATAHATPPHQDFVHIQGTQNTWTCWMPLGDCPEELGGLAILPRSHKGGLHPVVRSLGAGNVSIPEKYLKGEWAYGPLTVGSVLMFPSMNVHKGMPNTTGNRMRFSVDFRYQPLSGEVTMESFGPHMGRLNWDEIYAGWKSDRHQYYWRDLPLKTVAFRPETYKFEDADTAPAGTY